MNASNFLAAPAPAIVFYPIFMPAAADVDPYARAILNLATATETALAVVGGAGFDLAAPQRAAILPPGSWFLSHVTIRTGGVSADNAIRVRVVRNATDRTDATTGTDVIANVITAGVAAVDYINLAASLAAGTLEFTGSQASGTALDNLGALQTGFVEAQRLFAGGDTVMVSIQSATAATGDITAPLIVTPVFSLQSP